MDKNIIAFAQAEFENLIFLPIKINNVPQIALFDTGAGMSFVTKNTAEKLTAEDIKSNKQGGNNNGAVFSFNQKRVESLSVGNLVLKNISIGILDNEALNFGEDSKGNFFPATMLLGWDIISEFCWKFDMKNKRVSVLPGGYMPKSNNLKWNHFPIINAKYKGEILPLGFDSGHTATMLDKSWLNRVRSVKTSSTLTIGIGSSATEEVSFANEINFDIGCQNILLRDVEIESHSIFGSSEGEMSGLFGADIIENAIWTIDYKSNFFKIST